MRSEQEMLELITSVARSDSRIRAAYLEGSRVNPNVPKDIFQDYDVGYIVTETKSFREDKSWIDRFGTRLYMQYPEENTQTEIIKRYQAMGNGAMCQTLNGKLQKLLTKQPAM